jgi:hypothetical protein
MPRTIYCRHEHCGEQVDIVAGQFPAVCPGCERVAKWSTTPGNVVKERRKGPRVPWDLSRNDRRFLRSLRIDPEDDEPRPVDPTIAADDPA